MRKARGLQIEIPTSFSPMHRPYYTNIQRRSSFRHRKHAAGSLDLQQTEVRQACRKKDGRSKRRYHFKQSASSFSGLEKLQLKRVKNTNITAEETADGTKI